MSLDLNAAIRAGADAIARRGGRPSANDPSWRMLAGYPDKLFNDAATAIEAAAPLIATDLRAALAAVEQDRDKLSDLAAEQTEALERIRKISARLRNAHSGFAEIARIVVTTMPTAPSGTEAGHGR